MARDNEFQAILPVRGKILNVRKATLDKIQKNAEIMTMIEAFGLKADMKTMKLTYEPEDLRYGKIIIESDADVDRKSHKKPFLHIYMDVLSSVNRRWICICRMPTFISNNRRKRQICIFERWWGIR